MASASAMPISAMTPGPYYSIDVECVATTMGHNGRAIAQISLIDQQCNCVLNLYVKPDVAVTSYMTPLTGVTEESLSQYGIDLPTAIATLKQHLPPTATLVGQNIGKDVQWCTLKEGTDFANLVDLAGLFRVFNERYKSFTYFGLDHVATVVFGESLDGAAHNAVTDAIKSMRLFLFYVHMQTPGLEEQWAQTQKNLLTHPIAKSFAFLNPTFEGVCMGNRKTCKCSDPTFLG
jgi:RNA exonuclease 4